MPKYALLIQYNGAQFAGFQRQENIPTVQGFLEETLRIFVRQDIRIHAAGRTDTGVHAIGQVAHFDCDAPQNTHAITACINHYGREIGVSALEIVEVNEDFHARFKAVAREYTYVIRHHPYPCFFTRGQSNHISRPLNLDLMQEAARKLTGQHNFESFRSQKCQANNAMRSLDTFTLEAKGDYIFAHLRARAFLHNQVRIMMGTILEIGKGAEPLDWIDKLIAAEDRSKAGPTAPAHGLYFRHVDYGFPLFKTKPQILLVG